MAPFFFRSYVLRPFFCHIKPTDPIGVNKSNKSIRCEKISEYRQYHLTLASLETIDIKLKFDLQVTIEKGASIKRDPFDICTYTENVVYHVEYAIAKYLL